jgi:endonuclease/exonuclease/phosphatase family metal-dependent hydrolase
MRAHEKPDFRYDLKLAEELERIEGHKVQRGLPSATDRNLVVATWNLTNFGVQKREDTHITIMAEIIKSFDVVAIQEVADNLEHLESLLAKLGAGWDATYTDVAGNQERLAYIFNTGRVAPTNLAAELAMRPYERTRIVIEEVEEEFEGFNRNPYIVGFKAGTFEFNLVNVHLYWNSFGLRRLEAKALSSWAKRRVNKSYPPNNDIILLGDFNMPKLHEDDEIFKEIKDNGLEIPKYKTEVSGTNLTGTMHYDELAFFPDKTRDDFTGKMGVFDFDKVLFPDLYQDNQENFFTYMRYYVADHRPLWFEFKRR